MRLFEGIAVLLLVLRLFPGQWLHADTPIPDRRTVLGTEGGQFTVNGRPTFLLGFSYYAALGATQASVQSDLEDFQRCGFNWLRVWATWDAFEFPVSAVDAEGRAREPYFGRLRWLVAECDRRGLIVDITLSPRRVKADAPLRPVLADFAAHQRAAETLCNGLMEHRNWYLDLANERDIRDARFVGAEELRKLRDRIRERDPARLITASFGGHDLSADDIRQATVEIGLDFLSRHRPRTPESPKQTETQTRACIESLRKLGPIVPVHDQEPFRRGYGSWQPVAADFLTDLNGAVRGGAAGWCFHNGAERDGEEPRRSFDLRSRRLWVQLDPEERKFVEEAHTALEGQR